jgi:hypothetical protein
LISIPRIYQGHTRHGIPYLGYIKDKQGKEFNT